MQSRVFLSFSCFCLCLIGRPILTKAQPLFLPGIVIDLQGDTLKGYIAELGGGRNYEECRFRKSFNHGTITIFKPEKIKAYWIEDRRYFKAINLPSPQGKQQTLFFEMLVEGEAHTAMKYKQGYYYLDSVQQIKDIPLNNNKKNSAQFLSVNDYITQSRAWFRYLQGFTQKCPELRESFKNEKKIRPNEENLIDIVQAYNNCLDKPTMRYGNNLPGAVFKVGINAGLIAQQLSFNSTFPEDRDIYGGIKFHEIFPEIGFTFITAHPRKLGHFSLVLETIIRSSRYRNSSIAKFTNTSSTATQYIDWDLSVTSLRFPVAVRYTIPSPKRRLSLQAGPVIDIHISKSAGIHREYLNELPGRDPTVSNDKLAFPRSISTYQIGGQLRLNYSNKATSDGNRWEISTGVESGMGIFTEDYYPSDGLKISSYQIGAMARFSYFL